MASSFYSNSQHIDFESVLGMDDEGMVSMFKALMASGLADGGSEEWFAESFELPVDGLGDLAEIPKDATFDARSIVSLSGEPVSLSGRKNQMKFEFRLLCDIMAKDISVKAGSFNAITRMVTPGSKQAKGFAIQISLLLANISNLELGASSEFPASKILTKKTVHRFVSINDRDGAEEAIGEIMQRAASKKRRAADIGAAVTKKKRSIKKKSLSTFEMVAVAQEAVPIQMIEKIDEQEAEPSAVDETSVKECFVPAVEVAAEETRCSSADDVDFIIQQVIEETREVDAPADKDQPAATEERHWFDLPYEDLIEKWAAERPVVTASDTDEEVPTMDVATAGEDQQVQEPLAQISNDDSLDADEQMSLEDILLAIPVDVPLPSSSMEITKIVMGKTIKIPGVTEWTWFLKSLPSIPADDKGKEILVEKDPIKGNPPQEHFFLLE
ncbi:hypothetical protein F511_43261 [Dorcoceras hygrometricum]|uniref:Uncharacterized protein n=1 Tax=Dorcoceras hygrometricum TaxID=472368 RepID=A0A2Z7BWF2_9LAMI|nr:hypothetical protein F511_43261 [Dorcoceras hygrometricum]